MEKYIRKYDTDLKKDNHIILPYWGFFKNLSNVLSPIKHDRKLLSYSQHKINNSLIVLCTANMNNPDKIFLSQIKNYRGSTSIPILVNILQLRAVRETWSIQKLKKEVPAEIARDTFYFNIWYLEYYVW